MNALMLELIPLIREGYCCSQLLVLLVLQQQGVENPGLVRAAGGLCHGMGQSGGACGLLTGGAAALGYLACKGAAGEAAHPMAEPLINEEWLSNPLSEVLSMAAYILLIIWLVKASMHIKKK